MPIHTNLPVSARLFSSRAWFELLALDEALETPTWAINIGTGEFSPLKLVATQNVATTEHQM